jgi:D-alanyl-D-alanine carboxypeptidase
MEQRLRRRDILAGLAGAPFAAPFPATAAAPDSESGIVSAWVAANDFNGVILTGHAGIPRYQRAFGRAVIETGTPASLSTRYAIGSASTWLTVAAVMRLVDRHALDLGAPISTWLPGLRADIGHRVTLRHLLSNTSGIPDRLSDTARTDPSIRTASASAAEIVARFADGDLAFAPGTRFDDTVLNWVIVRAVLEAQGGMAFPALIDSLVLQPLGLVGTGIAENGFASIAGIAIAYRGTRPPVRKMEPSPGFAAASGGFYATAGDLLRAAHGIFNSPFLSVRARREMLTVHMPREEYAIGGRVHLIAGRAWAWETGRIGGYRAHIAHRVAEDRTIIVLGNTDLPQPTVTALVERLAASPA